MYQKIKKTVGRLLTISILLYFIVFAVSHAPNDTAQAKQAEIADLATNCPDTLQTYSCITAKAEESPPPDSLPALDSSQTSKINSNPSEKSEETKPTQIDPNEPVKLDESQKSQMAQRINLFIQEYGGPLVNLDTGKMWVDYGVKYNRHPYAGVAIALADTGLGKQLSTPYNLGNVGNTDSCPNCTAMQGWEHGIESIFKTLANPYLKNATKLCHLSRGGWKDCPDGKKINGGKFYASSTENWNRNANYTISWLFGTEYKTDHSIILTDYFAL